MSHRRILIALACAIVLASSIAGSASANGIDTQGLEIDVYAMNMEQAANYLGLDITERIYFNNTGTSPFNGTMYSWLPQSALVFSSICTNPTTTVVRDVGTSEPRCIPFTRLETDEALKIDVNALGATLSGVRYAIRAWNRKHEPKLKVKVKQSRTAPIVYVYYEP